MTGCAVLAQDMLWCQEYAWHNRSFMRDLMIDIVEDVTKGSVALDESVNIHHNFCQCERCNYTVSPLILISCHADTRSTERGRMSCCMPPDDKGCTQSRKGLGTCCAGP